jgi:hypothetical protein
MEIPARVSVNNYEKGMSHMHSMNSSFLQNRMVDNLVVKIQKKSRLFKR